VGRAPLVRPRIVLGALAAAVVAGGVMVAVRLGLPSDTRVDAAVQLAAAGVAGLATYLVGLRLVGIRDPRTLLRPDAMGPAEGGDG
jgi:hypothetical protein